MTPTQIAQVCHETKRAYCATLGDTSQPPWAEAPEWQTRSAIQGVEYHLAHPGRQPRESHEQWLKAKLATGWKYGPVKDPAKKEHPCICSYASLPSQQKAKDKLFIAVINALREYAQAEAGKHYDQR